MRKFILFLTGGLIILSILFIFVNNFIETRNNSIYESEQSNLYKENSFLKSTNEDIVLKYNKIIDIVNKLKL